MSIFGASDSGFNARKSVDEMGMTGGMAFRRAQELWDPNSSYNQRMFGYYQKMAAGMAPTEDTLFGVNKSLGGLSEGSSATMALQQAKAAQGKATDWATGAWMKNVLENEGAAQGYLGMKLNADKAAVEFYGGESARKDESEAGFMNTILGLGGGLLARALNKKKD